MSFCNIGCVQAEMAVSHNAAESLGRFCRWQTKLTGIDHNYAILLTGVNICANRDAPCDTLGSYRIEMIIVISN